MQHTVATKHFLPVFLNFPLHRKICERQKAEIRDNKQSIIKQNNNRIGKRPLIKKGAKRLTNKNTDMKS
jgi:hypothetical protein